MRDLQKSEWILVCSDDSLIYIRDLDRGARSVTNDAERVTRELFKTFGDRKFLYKDSEGGVDELTHDKGRFTGYKPGEGFKCWNCDEVYPLDVKMDWGHNHVCRPCELYLFDEAEKREKRRDH